MNKKVVSFIKNFSYTISSNLVSLIVSTVVVLVVPKLIGVKEYGYWQLYLFYSAYVGFLHFGWNDGIYLRYGDKDYNEIDKKAFFSQFYMLLISQMCVAVFIIIISKIIFKDYDKLFIFTMLSVVLIITNIRGMLIYVLQFTNRIKDYTKVTIVDRIIYCLFIIICIFIGIKEYKLMIIADITGKLISLIFAIYYCKDIVFRKKSDFYCDIGEAYSNINVGIKLMFANIASMLIIGIVRFGIEQVWSIEVFGRVSLTLSVSNMMMIFINAIGVVMFPVLKRTSIDRLPIIYRSIRYFLMIILFGILIIYYPSRIILSQWLPQYSESLKYMALLFPMLVFEGKMSLLVNTYFKTLRKEKLLLKINIITLSLSIFITIVNTIILRNLDLTVISIVGLLAFRCIIAERELAKIIRVPVEKDILWELGITVTFIFTGWVINSIIGAIIFIIVYLIYVLLKKHELNAIIENMKLLLK